MKYKGLCEGCKVPPSFCLCSYDDDRSEEDKTMKDIFLKLIDKVFDFKTLVVLLVVLGFLKFEQAVLLFGVASDAVLKFIGR